jgi:hypothetical protein
MSTEARNSSHVGIDCPPDDGDGSLDPQDIAPHVSNPKTSALSTLIDDGITAGRIGGFLAKGR